MRSTALVLVVLLAGCAGRGDLPPLPVESQVDLPAFMGDWYVIGGILTPFEDGAHNAVETYRLEGDDEVPTRFRFREDGFDGDVVTFEPRGFVRPGTGNAVWGMQFVWPWKADYRIVRHDPVEGLAIIGRTARDYVWVMARTPEMDDARWDELVAFLGEIGYETAAVRRVPQRWPE